MGLTIDRAREGLRERHKDWVKTCLPMVCILFLGMTGIGHAVGVSSATLPAEVLPLLDNSSPGWKLASHAPTFVTGDFDNDGKKDYALQIIYGDIANRSQDLMVFLNADTGLVMQMLESRGEDPNVFLGVKKSSIMEPDIKTGADTMRSLYTLQIMGGPEGDRSYRWDLGQWKELPPSRPE